MSGLKDNGLGVDVEGLFIDRLMECKQGGKPVGMRIANLPLFDKVLVEEVNADYITISGASLKNQYVPMQHIISINADDIPKEKPKHEE